MEEKDAIINRVALSPLVTFDLEEYFHPGERLVIDLKDFLFEGLILKEKDFREKISRTDWDLYRGKNIAILCSADAIIPVWAYMLIAVRLSSNAHMFVFGDPAMLENALFSEALKSVDPEKFSGQKVVIKGCGRYPVPQSAYVEIARLLTPVVSSLMYGEACSTVPLYKRPGT
jgi:hypothetical protein